MSIWDILGVPKESDLKTIKKAYAKLLKENNPEDNAEEYQKLREAYDEAIKYKKREKDIEHQQTPYAYKSVACQRHLR